MRPLSKSKPTPREDPPASEERTSDRAGELGLLAPNDDLNEEDRAEIARMLEESRADLGAGRVFEAEDVLRELDGLDSER